MASEPAKSVEAPLSPDRLWAEQLAIGLALIVGLLIFMALVHPKVLSVGAEVFGPNDLKVYGWASAVGVVLQFVVHEAGTLITAAVLGLPLRFRFFGFGANATAILEDRPRQPWTDAVIGFAGPVTGSVISTILALIFFFTTDPDKPQISPPFFLGMACVGYFYNLFTLIPILDLEGGWIASAVAPQGWLLGLASCVLMLTQSFNLVLLCVVAFGLPRLIQLITARTKQVDHTCTVRQRWIVNLGYFALVLILTWLSTRTFEELPDLIRDTMGD